jgi:hypothetical protein
MTASLLNTPSRDHLVGLEASDAIGIDRLIGGAPGRD